MTANSLGDAPPKYSAQFKFLIAVIAAGCCVRVLICFVHNPVDYLYSDMLRHWNNGRHFPRGGYLAVADPIIYQVYICILQAITASNRYLVALAGALLSIVMPWTFYRAARNLGLEKIPSLVVWALIVWTPSLIVIYHFVMVETLLVLLEGVALWMTARYLRKGGTELFSTLVFVWILACLTKPTLIPLAGICVLWAWWKKSKSFRVLANGFVIALLVVAPLAVRSKNQLGFVAPFGNPWLTRIQLRSGAKVVSFKFLNYRDTEHLEFSSPSCFITPLQPFSHWAMRRAGDDTLVSFTIEAWHGERDWKDTYDHFNHDPQQWLTQWRENILLFFFAPSWPESSTGEWDGWIDLQSRWMWAPLIVVVLVLNAREFARRRFELIPLATTVFCLFLALQNVVIAEGRYHKPVEPLLLLNLVWVLNRKSKAEQLPSSGALKTGLSQS